MDEIENYRLKIKEHCSQRREALRLGGRRSNDRFPPKMFDKGFIIQGIILGMLSIIAILI
jgi:hypothetical protein